jgi:nucleoside-diphosphate-sugar epimerase
VILAVRSGVSRPAVCARLFRYPGLELEVDWMSGLAGVDVVGHVGARAHVLASKGDAGLSLFHKVNVDGTLSLSHQTAACGVKRFIFISPVKAVGESSERGQPFRAEGSFKVLILIGFLKSWLIKAC